MNIIECTLFGQTRRDLALDRPRPYCARCDQLL